MTDKPILFSGQMVRALLSGGKTQTRRKAARRWSLVQPGDRLWVREAMHDKAGFCYAADNAPIDCSRAPADFQTTRQSTMPGMFMPRWASRLTLVVISKKIERLQDISNDDAEAEGIESELWDQAVGYRNYEKDDGWFCTWPDALNDPLAYVEADQIQRRSFQSLWTSLHGKASWDANPQVFVFGFGVHRHNVDAMPKAEAA